MAIQCAQGHRAKLGSNNWALLGYIRLTKPAAEAPFPDANYEHVLHKAEQHRCFGTTPLHTLNRAMHPVCEIWSHKYCCGPCLQQVL